MPDLDEKKLLAGREYVGVDRIDGPLVFIKNTHPVGYQELVECVDPAGKVRLGMVLDTSDEVVCVQIFEGTAGLNMPGTSARFMGEPLTLGVTREMLGRVFNGLGVSRVTGGPCPRGRQRAGC